MSIKKTISLSIKTLIAASFCLCPIKKNKIVMESFGGKNFSDNPKVIALEIVKQKKPWDVVWLSLEKPEDLPEEIRWVKYGTIKALYEWGTARVWIDNVRHQFRPIKRKKQYYIQTWHGAFSLKCIEKDAEDKLDKEYVKSAKKDGYLTDAIISSCKFYDDIYSKSFWLNEHTEILKTGSPRNDALFQLMDNNQTAKSVRARLNLGTDTFVVLYAPTFRDDHTLDGYIKTFDSIVMAFENRFKRKCIVLIRMHPNVSDQGEVYQSSDKIINVSNYPDAQELAFASDCVISDYSSIMFDFLFLHKPVFVCALDIEKYNETRGLLPVIYQLPWVINQSNKELENSILSYDEKKYHSQVSSFLEKYPFYDDGKASERIVFKLQSILE